MLSPHKRDRDQHQRGANQRKGVALTSHQVTTEKIMMQTQVVDRPLLCMKHRGAVLMTATLHVS